MNYVLIALAVVIGVLVVALKLQGGQLHKVQIQLLSQAIANGQSPLDRDVQIAKDKLTEALKAYRDAQK